MEHPGRAWRNSGDTYAIAWGGAEWSIDLASDVPAFRCEAATGARLLGLLGLAATGRRAEGVFAPGALIKVEVYHDQLRALYEPSGWHGLVVRAGWRPSLDGNGLDLEVQASTSSVGELEKLEILVGSRWDEPGTDPSVSVHPRDGRSASLSYDGRESSETLQRLLTNWVPGDDDAAGSPEMVRLDVDGLERPYMELSHPHDVARRLWTFGGDGVKFSHRATDYGFFGFDLEKGVVLRGRLRGTWFADEADATVHAESTWTRFLEEPPPLGS